MRLAGTRRKPRSVAKDAPRQLSDPDEYAKVRAAGSVHPCEVEGCRLSQEEHHRLAYGIIAENRELRRQLRETGNTAKRDDCCGGPNDRPTV